MEKNMFKQNKIYSRKAISLIVLVITIVVVLILAAAVILTTYRTDIFDNSNKTVFLSEIDAFRDELVSYHSSQTLQDEVYAPDSLQANANSAEQNTNLSEDVKDIQDIIPSMSDEYVNKLAIVDGKLVFIGEDSSEKEWIGELGIETAELTINIKKSSLGQTSVSLDVSLYGQKAKRENIEKATIEIKKSSETEYVAAGTNGELLLKPDSTNAEFNTCDIDSLEKDTIYDIKVVVNLTDGTKAEKIIQINTESGNGYEEVVTDREAPTLDITSDKGDATNSNSVTYTFTFSEDVMNFEQNDITVSNGTAGKFTKVSNSKFTLVVSNSSDCIQTVSVAQGVCTDFSGNKNAQASKQVIIDRTVPTLDITSDRADITNQKNGKYTFTFSEEVKDFDASDISVVNGIKGTFAGSGNLYTLEVTGADDGIQFVTVEIAKYTDKAQNQNTKSSQKEITIDTTRPTLQITSNIDSNVTKEKSIIYTFKFNENVSEFDAEDINVTNGQKSTFSKVSDSEYKLVVNNDANYIQTVTVADNVCKDAALNGNVGNKIEIEIDRLQPILQEFSVTSPSSGSYKKGQAIIIQAKFNKAIYKTATKGVVDTTNAPVLKLTFGDNGTSRQTTCSNISTDKKIINYTYVITEGDNGTLKIDDYVGDLFDQLGDKFSLTSKTITGNTVIADTTLPVINSFVSNDLNWTYNDLILTGKAIDTLSGISAYQFSTDGNLNINSAGWQNIDVTTSEISKTYTIDKNGKYYFYVKDVAGNLNKKEINVENIDKSDPIAPTKLEFEISYNSIKVIPTGGNDNDGESGFLRYEYSKDNKNFQTSDTFAGIATGVTNTFYVRTVDKAGNTSSTFSGTATTKKLGKVTITPVPKDEKITHNVVVTISHEEVPNYALQYKIANGEWTNYTDELSIGENTTVYGRLYNDALKDQGDSEDNVVISNIDKTNYTISYELNGGIVTPENANPTTYTVENQITLVNPTKEGHTFLGWTLSDNTTPVESITIAKGSTGNRTYTAHWQVNNYTLDLNWKIDENSYGSGSAFTNAGLDANSFKAGLKVDGVDKGYTNDYYQQYPYGTSYEIYGIKIDGVDVTYSKTGTIGAANASIIIYLNTLDIKVNNTSYGSVSPTKLYVPTNSTFSTSGNILTLADGRSVTATAATNVTGYTSTFANWSETNGTISAKKEITANFSLAANKYTVNYNGNGATNGTTQASTHTYDVEQALTKNGYERKYTITYNHNYGGSTNKTQDVYYTFNGWNTKTDGSGTSYTDEQKVKNLLSSGALTLYAKWTSASNTYVPTRKGYTFEGWYSDSACTTQVADTTGVYTPTANITLYAKWNIKSYYLDLNWKIDENSYGSGSAFTNAGLDANSFKAGIKINGEDKGYTNDYYQLLTYGTTYEIYGLKLDGVDVEYSKTGRIESYVAVQVLLNTLNLKSNNEQYGSVAPTKLYVPTNSTFSTSGNILTLAGGRSVIATAATNVTGYTSTFANWSEANGTISAKKEITANFSLAANDYTVNYNGNGATSGSTAASTHTYDVEKALTKNGYERKYTITYNHNYEGSTNTAKTVAYTFNGWNTKTDGSGTSYTDEQKVKNLLSSGTLTLYAKWTSASNTYVPTREGYTFGGWYSESSCTTQVVNTTGVYTPTANITLYAKWTANTYLATYDSLYRTLTQGSVDGSSWTHSNGEYVMTSAGGNGGYLSNIASLLTDGLSYRIEVQAKASKSITLPMRYEGATNASKSIAVTTQYQTFYIDFTYDESTTNKALTFYSSSWTSGDNLYIKDVKLSKIVTYGSEYGHLFTPTKTGYSFGGWYTGQNGTGNKVENTTKVLLKSDQIIYAKWNINPYTISYDLDGGAVATANPTSYNVETNNFTLVNPTKTGYKFAGWTGTGLSSATQTVTIAKGSTGNREYTATWSKVELDKTSVTLDLSTSTKTLQLTATGDNAGTITWKSSNTSVATVSSSGLITAVANGTCIVTATGSNGGPTATCNVNVVTSPTGISLDKQNVTLDLSGTTTSQLTATIAPSTANTNTTVTWTSSKTAVATVSSSGKITAVANGTSTITAKTANGKTATCTVTVQTSPTSISITGNNYVGVGKTTNYSVSYTPTTSDVNKAVTWTSGNVSVATVSSSGVVTGIKAGTSVITAKTANGKTATKTITVTSISLNQTSITLYTNGTNTYQLTTSGSNYGNVTYTSNNTNVATISTSGLVTAKGLGECIVTATGSNGGPTTTCIVKVIEAVAKNETTGVHYTDLQTAADETGIGETVTLLKNVDTPETINIDLEFTLDTAGYTITNTSESASSIPVLKTAGEIIINGLGTISNPSGVAIDNTRNLVLWDVEVSSGAGYAVTNSANLEVNEYTMISTKSGNAIDNSGQLDIISGTISSSNDYAIKNETAGTLNISEYGNVDCVYNKGTINMTGGNLWSPTDLEIYAVYMENDSQFNFEGGTIEGKNGIYCADYCRAYIASSDSISEVSITNPRIEVTNYGIDAYDSDIDMIFYDGIITSTSKESISNNVRNSSPSVPSEYTIAYNSTNSNTSKYAEAKLVNAVAKNETTGVYYTNLLTAVDEAGICDTVTLLKDVDTSSSIILDLEFTLNTNGHVIKNTSSNASSIPVIKSAGEMIIEGGGLISNPSGVAIENTRNIVLGDVEVFSGSGIAITNASSSTLEINGATIRAEGGNAIDNNGQLNIIDGNITSTDYYAIVNNTTGIIEMSGGSVYGGVNNSSELTVSAGTITSGSTNWAVYMAEYYSQFNFEGGTLNGQNGIFCADYCNVYIAGADSINTISITNPKIEVTNYGIDAYDWDTDIIFYDGVIISAASDAISATIRDGSGDGYNAISIPSGKSITYSSTSSNTSTYAMAYIGGDAVAKNTNTGTSYTNLQTAINSANSGNTIQLLKSITLTSTLTVASGKNITLDFNDYLINNSNTYAITNNGTLRLVDNSGTIYGGIDTGKGIYNTGTLTITDSSYYVTSGYGIYNTGTVYINSVSGVLSTASYGIYNTGTVNVNGGSVTGTYGIYNGSSSAATTINGSSTQIKGTTYYGIRAYGTLTMSAGTVTGKTYGIYALSNTKATITGGTITGTSSYGVYTTSSTTTSLTLGTNSGTPSITYPSITGGNYGIYAGANAVCSFYDGVIKSTSTSASQGAITGTIDNVPANYSIMYSNSGKTATLGLTSNVVAINTTLNRNYTNLQTAIDEANSGNTIKLNKNSTVSTAVSIPAGKTIVLNTNSKTLSSTSTSSYVINNEGTLTVNGSGTISSSGNSTIYNKGTLNVASASVSTTASSKYAIFNSISSSVANIQSNANISGSTGIYVYYGTVNVTGGTVTGTTNYAVNVTSSTSNYLNVTDGLLTGPTGIKVSASNAVITGGRIVGSVNAAVNLSNNVNTKLTLGSHSSDTEVPSTESPIITGTTYGVYSDGESSTFNFYDGHIDGDTLAIQGANVDTTPDGYSVVYSNNGTIATLRKTVGVNTFSEGTPVGYVPGDSSLTFTAPKWMTGYGGDGTAYPAAQTFYVHNADNERLEEGEALDCVVLHQDDNYTYLVPSTLTEKDMLILASARGYYFGSEAMQNIASLYYSDIADASILSSETLLEKFSNLYEQGSVDIYFADSIHASVSTEEADERDASEFISFNGLDSTTYDYNILWTSNSFGGTSKSIHGYECCILPYEDSSTSIKEEGLWYGYVSDEDANILRGNETSKQNYIRTATFAMARYGFVPLIMVQNDAQATGSGTTDDPYVIK